MYKRKNGFTLVELLAVIVILAVILVIAVPQIMSTITEARKGALISSAKLIASSAESAYISNQTLGIENTITCSDVSSYKEEDYICSLKFVDGKAQVTLEGKGKFEGMSVCSATKNDATISSGCSLPRVYLASDFMNKISDVDSDISNSEILSINFYNDARVITDATYIVDISATNDSSVLAYLVGNGSYYDLSIVGNGVVVFPEDSSGLFSNFSKINSLNFNEFIDTSNVTDMNSMFSGLGNYNSTRFVLDLSSFDTSNVTDMSSMFSSAQPGRLGVTNIIFGSKFDTSNVTNMSNMFHTCSLISSLDISMFNTSNVTDMSYMFAGSTYYSMNLTTIIVGNDWNTDNVTSSNGMFSYDTKLVGEDGTKVSTVSVYDKTYAYAGSGGYLTLAR